jgi:hypothetical protein
MEQPTVETEKPKRPWILPTVVGVGAFLLGVGVGRFEGRLGARTYEGTYDVGWIVIGPSPRRSHLPPTTDQALWVGIRG